MKKRRRINNEIRLNNNCEHVLDMKEIEKNFYDTKMAESKQMDPVRVTFVREWISKNIAAKVAI